MDQNNAPQTPNMNDGKGFAVASLILGIISVVLSFFTWVNFAGLACGIVGVVCAVFGRKKSFAATGKSSGLAIAGLVLGIIGIVLSAIGVICTLACVGTAAGIANSLK